MHYAMIEAQKGSMYYRHGAIIVKDEKIIGKGHNYTTFRRHHNYGSEYSVHAEIDALNSVANRRDLKGATMYVIRLMRTVETNDVFGNSLPCRQCFIKINKFMRKYGLAKVYYSHGNID
jgi:deoxycytidylate deaminase